MASVPLKELLLREVETLPEKYQSDVLAFIRFLKIGLADNRTVELDFDNALVRARALTIERGITEQDIAEEIQAVRAGQ